MDFVNKIFRGDKGIGMIFVILCFISIVEVYSASSTLTFRTDYWNPILRHSMFLIIGSIIVLGVHSIKPRYFIFLGFSLPIAWILLIATRILGSPVNGSYRWIDIAGVSFQPSEIAKLCLITFTAYILSKRKDNAEDKSYEWIVIATAITCGIILIDNGSTAFLLAIIVFLMMLIGGIPFKKLSKLALILCSTGIVFFVFIKYVPTETLNKFLPRSNTWVERIKDFGEDANVHQEDFVINDGNYQVSHANIAIANGRIFGKMPGNSSERHFLPQAYSDFIYAIIIEETGLIGGIFVLMLYVVFFIRSGIVANRTHKLFPKLLVMGSSLILFAQALSNMAVAVNLIPVTGQTLPLISRGGTSTLVTCVYFGIILSVSHFETPGGIRKEEEIEREFEEAVNLN
jgi:cell division protein FtsW